MIQCVVKTRSGKLGFDLCIGFANGFESKVEWLQIEMFALKPSCEDLGLSRT